VLSVKRELRNYSALQEGFFLKLTGFKAGGNWRHEKLH
jgi:hypothetical protein